MTPICEECAISRELADVHLRAVEALGKIVPSVMKTKVAEWQSWLRDGELRGQTLPTIAPEILDMNRQRQPNNDFARAFHRKLEHELRTGHKTRFPPEM
jgi:hypothetical protein